MSYCLIEKLFQCPYCRVEKREVGLGERIEGGPVDSGLDSEVGAGIGVETELRVKIGTPERTEDVPGNAMRTFSPARGQEKHL